MTEEKTVKIGGRQVTCKIENHMSDQNMVEGVPLLMSTVRESWNKKGIKIPQNAMGSMLKLVLGSNTYGQITLSINIPVNLVYNATTTFQILQQMIHWAENELKASRFLSVDLIFIDKNGEPIQKDN